MPLCESVQKLMGHAGGREMSSPDGKEGLASDRFGLVRLHESRLVLDTRVTAKE